MLDPRLVGTVFGVVFVAQLPGKSAVTALVLAARHRPPPVLAGAALALAAQSAISVTAGSALSMLPARPVHVAAGLLFFASAMLMWRASGDARAANPSGVAHAEPAFGRVFALSLASIFVAEWGDLTQLATAALAARYGKPGTVYVGATLGLWAATSVSIFVGSGVREVLPPERTQRIAAAIFAIVGLAMVIGVV
ncbi:MAG TPA: TMEM165/GDT1 family protein [Polyangiaceae bacterium]|nr:TMEM165/GDT1 family protein [Polyangiaceae bacterium]